MTAPPPRASAGPAIAAFHPPVFPMPASRARWKDARFRGVFAGYVGVEQLVRNFIKSPHKWSVDGAKTYRFLREHLLESETGRPWSRAVSSEGTLENDERGQEVLVDFADTAAKLLVENDPRLQNQGLLLLAAVSAKHPVGLAVAKHVLLAPDASPSALVSGALEVAGWCFRRPDEMHALFLHLDQNAMTKDMARALARAVILREGALRDVDMRRLDLWSRRLRALLLTEDPGVAAGASTACATEALAALLRARDQWPGFLAADSDSVRDLQAAVRLRHDELLAREPSRHARTCAAMRRLGCYLAGSGIGAVVVAAIGPADEPNQVPPQRPTEPQPTPPRGAGATPAPLGSGAAPANPPPAQPSTLPPSLHHDPEQSFVIDAPATSYLQVAAPPGAGKTRVASERVRALVGQGLEAHQVLMISFTRAAVAEFRARLEREAANAKDLRGVEVTTIDSLAWRLLYGLDGTTTTAQLFGNHAANITACVARLQAADGSGRPLRDWLGTFRHVLIDEAQDLVGPRAELALEVLRSLAPTAGATVFADPCQAIYDWTTDGDGSAAGATPLLEGLRTLRPPLAPHELRTIHRTPNMRLQKLFLGARKPILGNSPGAAAYDAVADMIRGHADAAAGGFDQVRTAIRGTSQLVLFRTRAQVLMASGFLRTDGTPHRLRMSGLPPIVEPWIGLLLQDVDGSKLRRADFEARWRRHADSPALAVRGRTLESAWASLCTVAPGAGNAVDLDALRTVLARPRPPEELTLAESGFEGPVIGTIHASKGREAEQVTLMLISGVPKVPDDAAMRAEARVLYVGATRAVGSLAVGDSFKAPADSLASGRVWRAGNGFCQFEIGRDGDVDRIASAAAALAGNSEAATKAGQDWLAAGATTMCPVEAMRLGSGPCSYQLRAGSVAIGGLAGVVAAEIHELYRQRNGSYRQLPNALKHVTCIGATTVAVPDGDPRRDELHGPWRDSGFFLAPVIRALTLV
jgi:hypothetical protein